MRAGQVNSPVYLSARQLADRWQFHQESVRRMLRAGKLPVVKLGKSVRVALADVLAYEQQNRVQHTCLRTRG